MTGPLVRSVLYLPASNPRAVDKARALAADLVVLDLEDAVAPEMKAEARDAAVRALAAGGFRCPVGVRINGADTPWHAEDLAAIAGTAASLVVLPKVQSAETVQRASAGLPAGCGLWAMIETPAAVIRLAEIAAAGGALTGLMIGVNDLASDLGCGPSPDREPLKPWLAATVAAARAHGLLAIDGVFNAIEDTDGLAAECAQGRLYGFDGKSLIHPSQIAVANAAFAPSAEEVARAHALVAAFEAPEALGKGAIRVNGKMAEHLHLAAARRLLARHAACVVAG
ncbi:HpcH/HpaI aldolase/citrate lyase family protein [Rhizobium sp. CRIBSB]|nr:HpcH/HpaI aldolase/citrate lyase family protein [Rhizobium sp. CRIBSB]